MRTYTKLITLSFLILILISGCNATELGKNPPTATQVHASETSTLPTLRPSPLLPTATRLQPTETYTPTPDPTETQKPTATPTRPPQVVFRLHPVQGDSLLPKSDQAIFRGPFTDPGGVVFHEGAFHMFYNVLKDFPPTEIAIGYAFSLDGKDWTLMTGHSILSANQVPFANNVVRAASALVEEDNTWVLYFDTVEEEGAPAPISVVGRATAKSPTGPWRVDPEPVLVPTEGSWDAYGTMRPCVVKTAQGYFMYYQARDSLYGKYVFGLATSEDGIDWDKHPEPVFRGEQVTWGAGTTIRYPNVVKEDWGWVMFFRTSGRVFQNSLGIATSRNGIDWVLAQDQPVFDTADYPKWMSVFVLKAFHIEETWYIYMELETLGVSSVHLATFKKDLIPGENIAALPVVPTQTKIAIKEIKNIEYGSGHQGQELDIYLPDETERLHPVILMLHEGNGRKEQFISWGKSFAEAGYAVVASNYRGWPNHSHPKDVADAFCALAWIHTHATDYGFDPSNVYVLGHSAGGTLAAMLGVVDTTDDYMRTCLDKLPDSDRVQGAITFTGIFDFGSAAQSSNGLKSYAYALLGGSQEAAPDAWETASAITWIDGSEPPFLIFHGGSDQNIPPDQSTDFANLLEEAGVPVELVVVPEADHYQITGSAEAIETTLLFLSQLEQDQEVKP